LEVNIKLDQEIGGEDGRWMELAQDCLLLRASVLAALKLQTLLQLCLCAIYILHANCRWPAHHKSALTLWTRQFPYLEVKRFSLSHIVSFQDNQVYLQEFNCYNEHSFCHVKTDSFLC
jgi:hypothetical protein